VCRQCSRAFPTIADTTKGPAVILTVSINSTTATDHYQPSLDGTARLIVLHGGSPNLCVNVANNFFSVSSVGKDSARDRKE
jgi:hypothetical protein